MAKIPLLAARIFQLLAAAVVLGLSAKLYKDLGIAKDICKALKDKCDLNGLQPAVGYCAFVGAWGLLDVIVGSASVFIDAIPWIVTLGVDGLATVFYLAGGIRLAVLLGSNPCPTGNSYCDKLKADSAFLFFGVLATLALMGMGFFFQRRSGGGVSAV